LADPLGRIGHDLGEHVLWRLVMLICE